ncbi:MAG: excinuclease ABC subunit UvrC [Limibacillus sp.]
MVQRKGHRRQKDPTAGGKRAPRLLQEEKEAYQSGSEPAPSDVSAESIDPNAGAAAAKGLAGGVEAIRATWKTLPHQPGVYRMLDKRGEALYVGKARNLKKRVIAYTQIDKLPRRLQRMVAETKSMEVVTTASEVEALLLESNLIKRLMPRYNVLLRDDKSFPYILITRDHDYPQIAKHRGQHSQEGDYYGPFASAGAVNRTVTALEKAFLLRSCSDHVFANRKRPCLLYQIKRCSAPCVDRISRADYEALVKEATDFLSGRDSGIQRDLANRMERAAEAMDFEQAAVYRDRIRALSHIQSRQDINLEGMEDADVIALHEEGGQSCIQVFFFRAGRNYGNRAYFPSHDRAETPEDVMAAFVAQFYDNKPPPPLLLLSHKASEASLLAEALTSKATRKVRLLVPQRGEKRKVMEQALSNAREALARRLSESSAQRKLLAALGDLMGLDQTPERVEVYDNSHLMGTSPYGAMIVAGPEGFIKNSYRKFSIREAKTEGGKASGGDDYGMMREVMTRRFSRALKEDPERERGLWPDLVLLDGGKGQLSTALEVFEELGIADQPIAAVAKGPDRDAGRERIFLPGREPVLLPPREPLLYFIQRLRDEAHRFAIGSHRLGRKKAMAASPLDEIAGIGAKRKKALLLHFGSARAVSRAGVEDLMAVEGISETVAKKIHGHFNQA